MLTALGRRAVSKSVFRVAPVAFRGFAGGHHHHVRDEAGLKQKFEEATKDLAPGENVIVPLIANSLEMTLSSPPPLHAFIEAPLVVETDHLECHPDMAVEEILKLQGHEVTDVIGKERFNQNDYEKYKGLIPQNEAWTEFIDEKTGEWVYLDEFGDRVEKPVPVD